MQVLYERCAGIDVHKDQVTVAVRTPGPGPGGRDARVPKFGAFYGVLREMARWLASQGVTHVAMEATGVYTMPVYHALLEPGCFEQVLVCNAAHVKNVPGRKTDPLTEHSDVSAGHRLGGSLPLRPLTCAGTYLRGHKGVRAGCATTGSGNTAPYRPPAFSSLLVTPARNGLVAVQNGP